MKVCTRCSRELPRAAFYPRRSRGRDEVTSKCRECVNALRAAAREAMTPEQAAAALAKARDYKRANAERVKAKKLAWNAANPERCAASSRKTSAKWRAANVELSRVRVIASKRKKAAYYNEYTSNWQKANRGRCNAKYKAYMARKLRAMPLWADPAQIEALYESAQQLTRTTGFAWHVDHIVPLNSRLVCGLHTHENLQVIPGVLNLSKSNRVWPDMPGDEGREHGDASQLSGRAELPMAVRMRLDV